MSEDISIDLNTHPAEQSLTRLDSKIDKTTEKLEGLIAEFLSFGGRTRGSVKVNVEAVMSTTQADLNKNLKELVGKTKFKVDLDVGFSQTGIIKALKELDSQVKGHTVLIGTKFAFDEKGFEKIKKQVAGISVPAKKVSAESDVEINKPVRKSAKTDNIIVKVEADVSTLKKQISAEFDKMFTVNIDPIFNEKQIQAAIQKFSPEILVRASIDEAGLKKSAEKYASRTDIGNAKMNAKSMAASDVTNEYISNERKANVLHDEQKPVKNIARSGASVAYADQDAIVEILNKQMMSGKLNPSGFKSQGDLAKLRMSAPSDYLKTQIESMIGDIESVTNAMGIKKKNTIIASGDLVNSRTGIAKVDDSVVMDVDRIKKGLNTKNGRGAAEFMISGYIDEIRKSILESGGDDFKKAIGSYHKSSGAKDSGESLKDFSNKKLAQGFIDGPKDQELKDIFRQFVIPRMPGADVQDKAGRRVAAGAGAMEFGKAGFNYEENQKMQKYEYDEKNKLMNEEKAAWQAVIAQRWEESDLRAALMREEQLAWRQLSEERYKEAQNSRKENDFQREFRNLLMDEEKAAWQAVSNARYEEAKEIRIQNNEYRLMKDAMYQAERDANKLLSKEIRDEADKRRAEADKERRDRWAAIDQKQADNDIKNEKNRAESKLERENYFKRGQDATNVRTQENRDWSEAKDLERNMKKMGELEKNQGNAFEHFMSSAKKGFVEWGMSMSGIAASIFVFQQVSQIVMQLSKNFDDAAMSSAALTQQISMTKNEYDSMKGFLSESRQKTGLASTDVTSGIASLVKQGASVEVAQYKSADVAKIVKSGLTENADQAAAVVMRNAMGARDAYMEFLSITDETYTAKFEKLGGALDHLKGSFEGAFGDDIKDSLDDITGWINENNRNIIGFVGVLTEAVKTLGALSVLYAGYKTISGLNKAGATELDTRRLFNEKNEGKVSSDRDFVPKYKVREEVLAKQEGAPNPSYSSGNIATGALAAAKSAGIGAAVVVASFAAEKLLEVFVDIYNLSDNIEKSQKKFADNVGLTAEQYKRMVVYKKDSEGGNKFSFEQRFEEMNFHEKAKFAEDAPKRKTELKEQLETIAWKQGFMTTGKNYKGEDVHVGDASTYGKSGDLVKDIAAEFKKIEEAQKLIKKWAEKSGNIMGPNSARLYKEMVETHTSIYKEMGVTTKSYHEETASESIKLYNKMIEMTKEKEGSIEYTMSESAARKLGLTKSNNKEITRYLAEEYKTRMDLYIKFEEEKATFEKLGVNAPEYFDASAKKQAYDMNAGLRSIGLDEKSVDGMKSSLVDLFTKGEGLKNDTDVSQKIIMMLQGAGVGAAKIIEENRGKMVEALTKALKSQYGNDEDSTAIANAIITSVIGDGVEAKLKEGIDKKLKGYRLGDAASAVGIGKNIREQLTGSFKNVASMQAQDVNKDMIDSGEGLDAKRMQEINGLINDSRKDIDKGQFKPLLDAAKVGNITSKDFESYGKALVQSGGQSKNNDMIADGSYAQTLAKIVSGQITTKKALKEDLTAGSASVKNELGAKDAIKAFIDDFGSKVDSGQFDKAFEMSEKSKIKAEEVSKISDETFATGERSGNRELIEEGIRGRKLADYLNGKFRSIEEMQSSVQASMLQFDEGKKVQAESDTRTTNDLTGGSKKYEVLQDAITNKQRDTGKLFASEDSIKNIQNLTPENMKRQEKRQALEEERKAMTEHLNATGEGQSDVAELDFKSFQESGLNKFNLSEEVLKQVKAAYLTNESEGFDDDQKKVIADIFAKRYEKTGLGMKEYIASQNELKSKELASIFGGSKDDKNIKMSANSIVKSSFIKDMFGKKVQGLSELLIAGGKLPDSKSIISPEQEKELKETFGFKDKTIESLEKAMSKGAINDAIGKLEERIKSNIDEKGNSATLVKNLKEQYANKLMAAVTEGVITGEESEHLQKMFDINSFKGSNRINDRGRAALFADEIADAKEYYNISGAMSKHLSEREIEDLEKRRQKYIELGADMKSVNDQAKAQKRQINLSTAMGDESKTLFDKDSNGEKIQREIGLGENNISAMSKGFTEFYDSSTDQMKRWSDFGRHTAESFEDEMVGAFDGSASSFREFTDKLLQDFSAMIIKMQMNKIMTSTINPLIEAGVSSISGAFGMSNSSPIDPGNASINGSFAKGGAFDNGFKFFADGGVFANKVVSNPTPFRFASGGGFNLGVMGEAGPEAIIPLAKDSSGSLGIKSVGGGAGDGNMQIEINITNEGKEQLQASNTSANFDDTGKLVLNIVMQAMQTNQGGMRNMVKTIAKS